jgi:hypothetical protein
MKREIRELIAKQASYDAMHMAKLAVPMGLVAGAGKWLGNIGKAGTKAYQVGAARGGGGIMGAAQGGFNALRRGGSTAWKGMNPTARGALSFAGQTVGMNMAANALTPSPPPPPPQQQQPGY